MKQKKRIMRLRTIIGSTCLLLILMVGPAQATPLNLELFDSPDITVGFIDVTYDASTDQFVASGFALTFDDGNDPVKNIFFTAPNYNITATIDASGNAAGSLTIGGTIDSLGFTSGILLTGNLTKIGVKSLIECVQMNGCRDP